MSFHSNKETDCLLAETPGRCLKYKGHDSSLQCSQQAITFACDRRLSASNTGHSLGRLVQITFYYIGPLEWPKLHILLILMEFQLGH